MKLIPFLGFSGQAHDAMAFYAKALGGQVTSEMKYRDMPPSDGSPGCNEMPSETLDHVAHSQLEIGNAILMAADGPGGGEGSSAGGRHPVTPWGVPTKGYKTRRKKPSDKFIQQRRKRRK